MYIMDKGENDKWNKACTVETQFTEVTFPIEMIGNIIILLQPQNQVLFTLFGAMCTLIWI